MGKFAWLHLTDLHRGMSTQNWLWPNVRAAFHDDLARLHELCGPWDVVFFTGDLTQKGTAAEFELFEQTIAQLWERLAKLGSTPVLLAVPGNHDLARPNKLESVHKLLASWVNNPDAHEELWTDEASESRVAIATMFAAYSAWWAKRVETLPGGWELRPGLLPGDWSLTIPHGDRKIGVVGLNSSYVQLAEGEFEGKLHLDLRQFHAACGDDGPQWVEQHDISLLLTHHGHDWLGPQGREHLRDEIDVPGRFVAHLFGHMHEPRQVVIAEGGSRPRRRWQGPSLFGLEWFGNKCERLHGYTAGQIEFGENHGRVRLWPRRAVKSSSGERSFGPDRDSTLEFDNGTRAERIELVRPVDVLVAQQRQLERELEATGNLAKFEAGVAKLRALAQAGPAVDPSKDLGGRYQLLHQLGSGGFAEIWAALDRGGSRPRPVVIKLLHRHWSSDRGRAERFEQGAREMRRVSHFALVPILADVARDETGRLYYPMRWLLGGDLHARVSAGTVATPVALEALARALEGLEHAHECGLIHRDVKPSNILLDDDDRGWLSDFDLVRGSESAAHTRVGQGAGTQVYVAPEVIDDGVSDRRADVYGAGMCVLFVLGKRTPPSHVGALKPEYIAKLECGEPLRAAVCRAVAVVPGQRSETCGELIEALRGGAARPSVTILTPPQRPKWIHATGTDAFGEWASVRVGAVEQRMRKLAAGSFMMGSPASEEGRFDGEGPQHRVELSAGYWLADTPCTQAMWQAVMGSNPSRVTGSGKLPIAEISWDDIQEFLTAFDTKVPGFNARLPSEAEWEYACRAATVTARYGVLAEIAWYSENSGKATHEVGLLKPNSWGLYDMLGNVHEWCADATRSYAAGDVLDPFTATSPSRIVRGGSAWRDARRVRAAYRGGSRPGYRYVYLGFRLARGQGLRQDEQVQQPASKPVSEPR